MRRTLLIALLAVILVADGWLWLRLDTAAERIVGGSLLSILIAFWYHVLTVGTDGGPRR